MFYTPILLEAACSFSQDPVLVSQRLPESHGLVVITFDTGVNRVCMVVCESAVLVILLIDCSDVLSHGCKT